MNNKASIYKIIGLIIILIIIASQFANQLFFDSKLHLYFLNVGQGDSIYVRKMNNFDLLIDGGPNNKVINELGEVMPFWDHKIDYVMLTHPHADHVTGLIEVIKRYKIGQILATDAVNTTSEYIEFLNLVKEKHIPYRLVRRNDDLKLDKDVNLNILWPNESFYEREINNLNITSIVAKLTYNNFSTLFTGDAESEVQDALVTGHQFIGQVGLSLVTNVLKVPHHGSSNAADDNFINLVKPEITVFTVGLDNMFGHPAQSTLEKYQKINSKIYRTDQSGRIEVVTDGQKYWTKSEK